MLVELGQVGSIGPHHPGVAPLAEFVGVERRETSLECVGRDALRQQVAEDPVEHVAANHGVATLVDPGEPDTLAHLECEAADHASAGQKPNGFSADVEQLWQIPPQRERGAEPALDALSVGLLEEAVAEVSVGQPEEGGEVTWTGLVADVVQVRCDARVPKRRDIG
jgi:hypothetical protein